VYKRQVCMRALGVTEEHPHEVVALRVFKEGGKYRVEANGRICPGPGHELVVRTVERLLNEGFKVPELRSWITEQLQSWKRFAEADPERLRADAEKSKAKVRESIERIRRWAEQRRNDSGAQRWVQKKVSELEEEEKRIDRDLERALKAIADARKMLYGG